MSNSFYITTPLYYVNGEAHLGHAYTTILADVLTRYHRLFGEKNVHFLTGLDEHGQKVSRAAASENKSPQDHCDQMAVLWKEVWKNLGIQYDDFIRTTEPRHEEVVTDILNEINKNDDIYQKEYEGWYSVYEERFFTEKDLIDGKDPILGRPVEKIKENNYFFRMSKYQDWLIDHYKNNPDAVIPSFRLNEVMGFLKQPLGDLCISRPKSRLDWGIPIPWDDEYVTYVWFDALINYYTATLAPPQGKTVIWPADYHIIGKDILTTHAVYWPIMLHAADRKPPRHILAHGWWLDKDAARMSKSDGNVVNPLDLAKKYGTDEFRYYLMREMVLGQDANFSEEGLVRRINSDLANDLGNLYSRLAKLWHKFDWGRLPQKGSYEDLIDEELNERILSLESRIKEEVINFRPHAAIEEIMQVVRGLNGHVEHWEPWKFTEDTLDLAFAMMGALDALYKVAELLEPVMPVKMAELKDRIYKGNQADRTMSPQLGKPLFPRINIKR
ncbi:methionine--tRNA ligase [bacterium]|nr:methionine--tRNA ligase [bacterium]